jgi:hypothetical protein
MFDCFFFVLEVSILLAEHFHFCVIEIKLRSESGLKPSYLLAAAFFAFEGCFELRMRQ